MDIQYGSNIEAVVNDPNGPPGVARGGVNVTTPVVPPSSAEYKGNGPSPYPQNSFTPDPLDEAWSAVGPEG
jgi:hypothetical protein